MAIGLASRAAPLRWWLFALGMLMIGGVGLVFLTPTALGTRLGIGYLLQWPGPMPTQNNRTMTTNALRVERPNRILLGPSRSGELPRQSFLMLVR